MQPADFIALIAPAVQEAARRYPGVYASVGIAQAILESGWGRSELARKTNNYFGVKAHGGPSGTYPDYVTGVYLHRTTERPDSGEYVTDAYFRTYADARGSALDWADNLKSKKVYADAGAWTATSADGFIQAIGRPYTGNDGTYSVKVIDLMNRYNLRDYDTPKESPMRIIPRAEWGARPARSSQRVARDRRRTFVVHYDGENPVTRTGPDIPKAIQNFHMDGNGWRDAGYNFAISQAGDIYEMRGWDEVGAHAGSVGNVEGIGVQVAIGGNQQPSEAALRSLVWLKGEADRLMGRSLTWKQHGDYMSTSCAGGPLRAWLAAGRPLPGSAPAAPRPSRYARPVSPEHRVTAAYHIPGDWQAGHHTGIDFGCPVGTPVYSVSDGDVRARGTFGPDYGITVTVNEDDDSGGAGAGSDWTFCHLSRAVVKDGQRVKAGDLIGYSGNTGRSTGPHLHLERRPRMGGYGTDLNPVLWDETNSKPSPTRPPLEDDMPASKRHAQTLTPNGRDWSVTEAVVLPSDGPAKASARGTVTVPADVTVTTRWVSFHGSGGDGWWRDTVVTHSPGTIETTVLVDQASPADLRLDVKTDKPCKAEVELTAQVWKK